MRAHAPTDQEESVDRNRSRDLGYAALERHDREQSLIHQPDWLTPSRSAQRPKIELHTGARIGERSPSREAAGSDRPRHRPPAAGRAD